MQYISTAPGAVVARIAEVGFSPYYDIVWSFDYYVQSLSATSQLGFCIFLQDITSGSVSTKLGNGDIDLGYSGLSGNTVYSGSVTVSAGLENAIIGVGFDSTGCFALSAKPTAGGAAIRDGVNDNSRILNSMSVRGHWPNFSWSQYSVNVPLSTFGFTILDTQKKTIRARLGNAGQTLYVDYRTTPLNDFTNILTQNVILSSYALSGDSRFRPGVVFVKPVSGTGHQPTVKISNFTVEGKDQTPAITTIPAVTPPILILPPPLTACIGTTCNIAPSVGADPPPPPIVNGGSVITLTRQHTTNLSAGLVRAYNTGYETNVASYDFYNYGYSLFLSGGATSATLYRVDYYQYRSTDNTIVLNLSSQSDMWRLTIGVNNYSNNTHIRPVGTFGSYSITYLNE